ncbi:SUMF1/EgtB/PvdO family nonheme iron enzyme [Nannocystis punicea]|uniref:SUMF1/EgtB/PvdO family nonheme iron enzyme n=1 Tax=Nannocystis punicea TaxID=2995304 RepID=A0ABY7HBA6_9BACT|nr:SUMF1/EgtB/PvdO family nonheme iron enzyme [Nannocystis poenicansa]WAS96395.1 SUMF1/EgtB/PvdO family nonheme iron enzyme [Nannocystis poenicansa]
MRRLHELLCKLYPRTADLRRFLSHGEQGADIARHMPEEGVGIVRLADDAVAELVRRGLVQDALQRAAEDFPRQRGEIEAVARACGVDLAAPGVGAPAGRDGQETAARRSPKVAEAGPAEADAGPLRWLHLSDLHVGCRGEAAWWHVLDQFWRSVDEHLKIVGTPDLVLLTGDLTFKGEPAEFDRLTKFLEKLLGRLPKAADGHPPLVVAVPGNHEVQRPTGREALQYRVLRDFEKGRDDPDVADLLKEFWDKQDASFLRPLFANYLAWFDRVIRPGAVRPGVKLTTSFFPGDVYVELVLPGRFPLSIVGLNSAWMQYQGGDFEGKLALPLEQFQAALPHAQGESPLGVLEATHRALLLMHHPRSWLSKPQRQLFDSGIYPGGRFVACLHGHMHEPDAINKSEAGGVARCYYQAPSLFGVEKYGSAEESRAIGYTWATLRDDGELRAWPLKLKRKGDGTEVFDRDDFFHWDSAAGNVLLRPGDGRRFARPRASGGTHGGGKPASDDDSGPRVEVAEPAAILAYRAWVLQQKPGVTLIGVGGGDMSLDLDAVYVPLRARPREHLASKQLLLDAPRGASATVRAKSAPARTRSSVVKFSAAPKLRAYEPFEFEVDRLFGHVDTPHALILGEPGSGKTTALHKLLHVCAREGPETLGLPEGTVPVPLWLRRFSNGRPLAAWLQDELGERSGGKLSDDLGAALWAHGRLLLLADGLDEVADESLRARLCEYLGEQLAGTQVRAVVSSRYAGYRRAVKLPEKFAELELRPLSGEQVDRLVRQWFAEAVRVVLSVSEQEAQARGRGLIAALHSPTYSTQRLKVMVSTPLLLTLLCVIVHQGRPMPRSRAEYYERCLEVLLLRWGQEQKRREPPLVIDKAMAVLRPLAYTLQASGDRDTRMRGELVVLVRRRLRELGLDDNLGVQVVDWLQRDAGVLQEFAPEHLGFAHLGLQEYLAATHIVGEDEALYDELAARLGDPWWHEVARLVAAQRVAFVPLMRRVLKSQVSQGELLGELLDEAPEADATPLLERLDAGGTSRERATVLRLLRRFSGDERVREVVMKLRGDRDAEVRALAAQLLEVRETGGKGDGVEVVLVFPAKQRPTAEALARELRGCGVQVLRDAHGRLFNALELNSELATAGEAPCAVVLSGRGGPAWADAAVRSCLAYFADAKKPMAWALLPGGEDAVWPAEFGEAQRFDARDANGLDALRGWLATARRGARGVEKGQPFVEETTGIRFLWVPGGRFEMGMEGVRIAEPVYRVRLSPYWLAETPVTNAQYAKFLAARRREPTYWRDRQFSHEEQPVVGVSWDDAMQFCAWLSKVLVSSGVKVTLPSEAQWEFAARGTDSRRYPWGNEEPDATRAVFGREDGTAKVGSCPAGRGPFGHLDLAGNVWQWCRDGYNLDDYERRRGQESVDPVVAWRDNNRMIRSSSWRFDGVWAAAARDWRWHDSRYHDGGFRVAAEPASPLPLGP